MLSSLLTQFRHRYPQGNLTSDLLTIHDGLYLVRVCAGAEGVTLACGLSAHATLEQAEDLATTRALERLGLTTSESPRVAAPAAIVQAQPPATAAPLALVPHQQAPDPSQPVADAPPILNEPSKATPPGLEYEPSLPDPEPPPIALTPPPPSAPTASAPPDNLSNVPDLANVPDLPDVPDVPDDFDNDLINLGAAGPVASVDLSDIIAQTDVELQRLGWDVNQGREFLEKTYGKRSRHDLTDDELLEFLLYLETQSPPSAP